jgi:hypothetical protein
VPCAKSPRVDDVLLYLLAASVVPLSCVGSLTRLRRAPDSRCGVASVLALAWVRLAVVGVGVFGVSNAANAGAFAFVMFRVFVVVVVVVLF